MNQYKLIDAIHNDLSTGITCLDFVTCLNVFTKRYDVRAHDVSRAIQKGVSKRVFEYVERKFVINKRR